MKKQERNEEAEIIAEALKEEAGIFLVLEKLEQTSETIKYLTCCINDLAQRSQRMTEAVTVKLVEMAEERNEGIKQRGGEVKDD